MEEPIQYIIIGKNERTVPSEEVLNNKIIADTLNAQSSLFLNALEEIRHALEIPAVADGDTGLGERAKLTPMFDEIDRPRLQKHYIKLTKRFYTFLNHATKKHLLKIIPLFFLLGCGINNQGTGETIFSTDLYVYQVEEKFTLCAKQKVTWGFKNDSICFDLDRVRCFIVIQSSINPQTHEQLALVKSDDGKYTLRYLRGNGFIIFITHLEKKFPHFVLSTQPICKNEL